MFRTTKTRSEQPLANATRPMSPASTTSNLSLPPEPEAEKENEPFVTSSFSNSCEYLERKTIKYQAGKKKLCLYINFDFF